MHLTSHELLIVLLVETCALLAIVMVGAFVSDNIVQPWLDAKKRKDP